MKLADSQDLRRPVCGRDLLLEGEELHRHHKRPRSLGGTDVQSNRELVHLYCHQQWHARSPQELEQYEKEKQVPYITSVEPLGMERGKREGLLEGKREGLLTGITSCLKLRFGAEGLELLPAIQALTDLDRLGAILKAIETATNLDEVRRLCAIVAALPNQDTGGIGHSHPGRDRLELSGSS